MKIALAMTVKNERDLLRSNILYHHYLGIDEFYIYGDRVTDDTLETVADLPFAFVQPSVSPEPFRTKPEYKEFVDHWETIHTARQNLNTCAALETVRQRGFDWLIALDADELVCLNWEKAYSGQIKEFLESIPEAFTGVQFVTYEVVQRRTDYRNVFLEEQLFKKAGCEIRHRIYDPFERKLHTVKGFYGQSAGKSAIRLSMDAIPHTTHWFVRRDGSPISIVQAGYLLHYYGYSFKDFMKKYRNMQDHPDDYLAGGNVEYQKRLWRDMVNRSGFTESELLDYYQKWVLFQEKEIKRYTQRQVMGIWPRKPSMVEIVSVRNAFQEMMPPS